MRENLFEQIRENSLIKSTHCNKLLLIMVIYRARNVPGAHAENAHRNQADADGRSRRAGAVSQSTSSPRRKKKQKKINFDFKIKY